ncbi:MAG: prephenate dehydrogenase [Lachnospiraceae bacterium]|nr:prephenate dehydrogenase [Lachnospiraceae bacterium]
MAKSIAAHTGCRVYGLDMSDKVMKDAISDKTLSGRLDEHYGDIDMLIVALYPLDVVRTIEEAAPKLKKGCIVIDCTGVKQIICSALSQKLAGKGLRFIGGHPMAGKEVAGYSNSCDDLFDGASMILCRDEYTDEEAMNEACDFFPRLGFAQVKITNAEEHDAVIAYTSQLAHVTSSAYIKSPTLDRRYGFSAGSFKDMTRVAKLNEEMWADLFLANDETLLGEIETLSKNLSEYRKALSERNRDKLVELLREGRVRKENDELAEQSKH